MTTGSFVDLDMDAMVHCSSYLDLQDVCNLAMTSKHLKSFADSDPVWQNLFRKHWPFQLSSVSLPAAGVREAYISRHTACHQFKFNDPWASQFLTDWSPCTHILLDKNDIIVSQDSNVIMKMDAFLFGGDTMLTMNDHSSRITCMRLFPLQATSLFRSQAQEKDNVLVTSSRDNTIRLWWKGRSHRCFKGHHGPVTTLADRLLGDPGTTGKVLASGGEDGTVRLWSLDSYSRRGKNALQTTFFGHEKSIAFLSVARHKDSLLVSISKDAKVRVWDATRSSLAHSSGCVGMTVASGGNGSKCREPVGMKCHESLLYVATGSLVTAVDLRTMGKAFAYTIQPDICSFQMLPSRFLICTGGNNMAMLWDIRKSQEKPEPVTEFEHSGSVSHLHMDPYKVVTGSLTSSDINVWDPKTGKLLNSFKCYNPEYPDIMMGRGCSAMAVSRCRIVTEIMEGDLGFISYKDYTHATSPISSSEADMDSKFWAQQPYHDCDDSD